MYKVLVALVLITPLIGIWLVEGGEFAPSVGLTGHDNGATVAFAAYAFTVAAIAWLVAGRTRVVTVTRPSADPVLRRFGRRLLVLSTVFLLVFLFGFGAIRVWTGEIGKGEFRVGLGVLAALPNLMTKFILPALLAYAAALYRESTRARGLRRILGANMVVIFAIGASWGFKSTAFLMLMPALLLLYWRVGIGTLLKLGLAFALSLTAFFFLFDAGIEDSVDVQTFLLRRITVLQGDVAWYIWGQYRAGETFPPYGPTLLAAFGDKLLTLAGLAREDFATWTLFHYDLMITQLAGALPEQVEEGHSITATPFAEGLVAGGTAGVALFAVLAGLLVGRLHVVIARALARGRQAVAAVAASYFCFLLLPWLNGGAVVQLFHISVWAGLGATLLAIELMRSSGRRRRALPVPATA